jgi:hypothetical protein
VSVLLEAHDPFALDDPNLLTRLICALWNHDWESRFYLTECNRCHVIRKDRLFLKLMDEENHAERVKRP